MAKQVGISELVNRIGDADIKFQCLDTCATSMRYDHKKGSTITFGTDEPLTLEGTERIGLILWLPRDKVAKALAEDANPPCPHEAKCAAVSGQVHRDAGCGTNICNRPYDAKEGM